ncbi:L-rhamnose mutarotase [Halomicroarcula sp. S1AR25-4]|uniref:L-rhamnose mutarotase n=1 Tax=Haloarcula sp. S1AR25-4 TaxID=2950538 RepID=UPI002873FE89|nr:L-rhamnose mutarotase [Halomicroarcula sp. S1AR25-4]MDS0276700.1 L-rhamnose mutarotase [Halomicroarcula sp. S1AR25-4]
MPEDTERAVYVQRLDPDQREAYVEAHDDVPDAVTDAMDRGGVEAFELYVRDDVAVCILECNDLDAYLDAVDGDEAVAEWERYTGQFKQSGVDADADPESGIPFMECIWRFEPEET